MAIPHARHHGAHGHAADTCPAHRSVLSTMLKLHGSARDSSSSRAGSRKLSSPVFRIWDIHRSAMLTFFRHLCTRDKFESLVRKRCTPSACSSTQRSVNTRKSTSSGYLRVCVHSHAQLKWHSQQERSSDCLSTMASRSFEVDDSTAVRKVTGAAVIANQRGVEQESVVTKCPYQPDQRIIPFVAQNLREEFRARAC